MALWNVEINSGVDSASVTIYSQADGDNLSDVLVEGVAAIDDLILEMYDCDDDDDNGCPFGPGLFAVADKPEPTRA